jgi:hypothetical protein
MRFQPYSLFRPRTSPGWAEGRAPVRIRVDGMVYEGQLERIKDASRIQGIRAAYLKKYELAEMPPNIRYSRFLPHTKTAL